MTRQLAIRLDDADLEALDELAAIAGVSRSEAARHAIRQQAANTVGLRNLSEQRRIDALLGVASGGAWSTVVEVLAHPADAGLSDDLKLALGDESTDDMLDPWQK